MRVMVFAAGGDMGGAKTHILSLAKELSNDNELKLISFRKGVLSEEALEMGIDVSVVDNGLNIFKDIKGALEEVDTFKPDIIHCHGAKSNMLGIIMKAKRSLPVMTTVHSDPAKDYMGSIWKQWTYGLINALALRRMDFYIAVAEKMERTLVERGFDPLRIFTIYNGLDFSQAPEEAKAEKNPQDDIVVGIAARLTPIKDIGTLLKAFKIAYEKNNRLLLRIAGTGEDGKDLQALAKNLAIDHRVEFVGWISDVKGFFAGVDINVLASLSEGFPYSLLEGAFQHCPAIATRVGGIPALINHGENGYLFEPGDVETFAEYIYKLSVDEKLRQDLGENLFAKAKAGFSLEKMKSDQEKVYGIILKRKAQRGRQGAVICGAYGRGNAGDEAILKAILLQLKEIDEDMPFWVMTRRKMETRLAHKVRSMYLFNIFVFFSSLRKAKIFVNGGGSLIQDITSSRSLYFYLFTLKAAKLFGCKIVMYGCGIGPLDSPFNRKMAARVLNSTADIITLRDSVSLELLKEMQVDKPEILLSADPVVHLEKAGEKVVAAAFEGEGVPADLKKIGFCLRNWPDFTNKKAMAEAADHSYEKYGLTPVFLPIETPKDVTAAEKVVSEMKGPYYECRQKHGVEELIGMLGSMDLVVGMRLHSLIFATAGGAPVIGVSYDVKVDSFIKDIGSDACIPVANLKAEDLIEQIDRAMARDEEEKKKVLQALKAAQEINIDAARRLIETDKSVLAGKEENR